MTVQTLTIGKRRFVLVPERDFDRLRNESSRYRQMVEEDGALGRLAERELKAVRTGRRKTVPYEQLKRELGL